MEEKLHQTKFKKINTKIFLILTLLAIEGVPGPAAKISSL